MGQSSVGFAPESSSAALANPVLDGAHDPAGLGHHWHVVAGDHRDPLHIAHHLDSRAYAVAKRLFDVLFALVALAFTSPLWLLVALLVWATSPGPIIYRQTRLGRGGRPFTCLKFRSMVRDADVRKIHLLHRNEVTGPVFKIEADPRVTPVGKWLRKLSIDELPQLLNVLAGQMSVVGPRPPIPDEVEHYAPWQRGRLAVKPGLTCIWQVSGRSLLGFEEWMRLDLEYIRRRSFWFDLVLVVRTVPAVLLGRGAH